ncbi:MAG TPA: bifunctional hydroxymethylpyrimidine kinase/phosphomethylpyrimidine kinase [Firmicutes bacterium]|nr:bifunctional hydroxymethylpyrimidine kinase/phosphomethylpyrimidine kinase [Bacillota bacterium]
MKKVLSIAGSDCSGGAGIQADLKTMTAHGVYGMSVITALTAQNTTGVYGVLEVEPEFVGQQLECVMNDIYPDAVKIGMVSSAKIIEEIANQLKRYDVKNIVLDPVMVSTSGSRLLSDDAMEALTQTLMPLATLITPNIHEAECLCGFSIANKADMVAAAKEISKQYKGQILIKGGHLEDCADDLLYQKGEEIWFSAARIHNPNTHGTGCTLSSAIACQLALGLRVDAAVSEAKSYISQALAAQLDLGKGSGPINHCVSTKYNKNVYC